MSATVLSICSTLKRIACSDVGVKVAKLQSEGTNTEKGTCRVQLTRRSSFHIKK